MKRTRVCVVITLIGALLSGCAGNQYGNKQTGGALLGGALGGLFGSQIGGGTGRLAATAGFAVLGLILGSEAGKSLDRADQLSVIQTTHTALETAPTGSPVRWQNPDQSRRTYGYTVPTRTYQLNDGRYCREYQQKIIVAGREQDAYGKACRQPDGTWQIVNDQSSDATPVIMQQPEPVYQYRVIPPYPPRPVVIVPYAPNYSAGYRARVRWERHNDQHGRHWWH